MTQAIGRKRWAIAEGYIPKWSHGPEPEMKSHESLCILNAADSHAEIEITIFFTDREPAGPFGFKVEPKRTKHIRLNELKDPESIPAGVEFSSVVESNVPIVVQHTRLDSRQAEN